MKEYVFMNFLKFSEITGKQFLMGKNKLCFCISWGVWRWKRASSNIWVLNLSPHADELGRFGGYIYSTVNLETNKMPNSRR